MHLFISKPAVDGKKLVITEERLVHQIKNVLRLKAGEEFEVQDDDGQTSSRWLVALQSVSDQIVLGTIQWCQTKVKSVSKIGLLIGLPNKSDKLDVIVQKTTEVGIDKIIFWPSQRSELRTLEANRMERLVKIAREASEQSKRRFVPEIAFTPTLKGRPWLQEHRLIVFDFDGEPVNEWLAQELKTGKLYGVIGPEGWLHPDDLALLEPSVIKTLSLGEYTLRTETAAIVVGWLLNNLEDKSEIIPDLS